MNALIVGASRGIGLEMARQLLARGDEVIAACRTPDHALELRELEASGRLRVVRLDVEDESSIAFAAETVWAKTKKLNLLIHVAGLLHEDTLQPEKKLDHVNPRNLHRVFAVNAFGPLLVAKHFSKLLLHDERAVLANVSARVGSIEDNRLGGWYAYRASKAAQNMFTRNLAIELGRRRKNLAVIALHPGTVETDLSAPFRSSVPEDKLFSVERAARQLLAITDGVGVEDTGSFFAWDGSKIPW